MDHINFSMPAPASEVAGNVSASNISKPHIASYVDFIVFCLQVRTQAKFIHWATYKFSTHLAVGEFYDELEAMVDEMAEMMMGSEETLNFVQTKVDSIEFPSAPNDFMAFVRTTVLACGHLFDHEPGLKNKYDEIVGIIDRTKYKIERLVS